MQLEKLSKFVSFKEDVLEEISERDRSTSNSKRVTNTVPSLLKKIVAHKRLRKESPVGSR